jgi:phage terminase small subunit
MSKPRQPKGLGSVGAALWRSMIAQLAADGLVPDAREVEWLTLACLERDQLAQLMAALEGEPLTVFGSARQRVAHPLVSECRQSRNAIAALLARVGLEDPLAADKGGSGSRTTSQSARRAALTRHHGGA